MSRPTTPAMQAAIDLVDKGVLKREAAAACGVTVNGINVALRVRDEQEYRARGEARKAVKKAGLPLYRSHVDRARELLGFYRPGKVVKMLVDEASFMTGGTHA